MDDADDNTDRGNLFGRKERIMSVLIKGMEKPEHCGYCRFRYDGICHALQKTQYSMNECPLVVIDDVGLNDTISTSIDAVPVKHGRWKYISFLTVECSECKAQIHDLEYSNFCPSCGARMDAETRNNTEEKLQ